MYKIIGIFVNRRFLKQFQTIIFLCKNFRYDFVNELLMKKHWPITKRVTSRTATLATCHRPNTNKSKQHMLKKMC